MHDWQMYDREALLKISEEEEAAFKSLPEEQQKAAVAKRTDANPSEIASVPSADVDSTEALNRVEDGTEAEAKAGVKTSTTEDTQTEAVLGELPPLIGEEQQVLKDKSDCRRFCFLESRSLQRFFTRKCQAWP